MNHADLTFGDLLSHLRQNLQLDPSTDLLPLRGTNEPWHTPTPGGPWSFGSPVLQYMKDGLGFVHLRGNVSAAAAESLAAIFTLPEGYRPGVTDFYGGTLTGAGPQSTDLAIDTSGLVSGSIPAAGTLYVNGITFLAEL